MSADAREYHRTFLHWPRRGGMADFTVELARKRAGLPGSQPRSNAPAAPSVGPRSNAPAAPSVGARSGAETDPRKFHQALEINGSHLEQITIQEKGDQKFEQHATPWEREWSRLVVPGNPLSPVVDGNAAVVGYSGVVKGSDLLIGRGTWIALVYTPEETIKYHQMFVGGKNLHAVPNLDVYQDEWVYYSVLTDVYGEVTSFQFSYKSNNGVAERTDFPFWGWLRQILGGLKLVISLRNGFRTLTRPRPLPRPVPRQLPPGSPAASGSKDLVTVGRWMSRKEHDAMVRSGLVQESPTGGKNVLHPASPGSYKAIPKGDMYVEFDVPKSSLVDKSVGQKLIPGPNSLHARLAVKKGLPTPQMPPATNIRIVRQN